MEISDLLAPEAVLASLKTHGKKQLLQEMAERAARLTGLPDRRIFETLIERERLGTTGVGSGIAIPHGRMAGATSITGGPSGASMSSLAPAMYSGTGGPGTLDTTRLIGARFRDRPLAVYARAASCSSPGGVVSVSPMI